MMKMAEQEETPSFVKRVLEKACPQAEADDHWVDMEGLDDVFDSTSSAESSMQDSRNSAASTSSDLAEDASSSSLSSPSSTLLSSHDNGPLYELSELMAQLPIKRGLSKFYQGKSQSYTSLARVKSIEDLAKRGAPYRPKMKSCKSYAAGLDGRNNKSYGPKATITKKSSSVRGSFFSSLGKKGAS